MISLHFIFQFDCCLPTIPIQLFSSCKKMFTKSEKIPLLILQLGFSYLPGSLLNYNLEKGQLLVTSNLTKKKLSIVHFFVSTALYVTLALTSVYVLISHFVLNGLLGFKFAIMLVFVLVLLTIFVCQSIAVHGNAVSGLNQLLTVKGRLYKGIQSYFNL